MKKPRLVHMGGMPIWCSYIEERTVDIGQFDKSTRDKAKVTCADCLEIIRVVEDPNTVHRLDYPREPRKAECGLKGELMFATRDRKWTCPVCNAKYKEGKFILVMITVISLMIVFAILYGLSRS